MVVGIGIAGGGVGGGEGIRSREDFFLESSLSLLCMERVAELARI
jgi:hypothetical protein